jgi:hypothetical protein
MCKGVVVYQLHGLYCFLPRREEWTWLHVSSVVYNSATMRPVHENLNLGIVSDKHLAVSDGSENSGRIQNSFLHVSKFRAFLLPEVCCYLLFLTLVPTGSLSTNSAFTKCYSLKVINFY